LVWYLFWKQEKCQFKSDRGDQIYGTAEHWRAPEAVTFVPLAVLVQL